MAYTLTEDTRVDLPDTGASALVRTKDAKRQRLCIPVLGVVARVFPLASGVASCLLCASYAFYAVCTLDFVTSSGSAFPYFSCFARSTCFADKLGGGRSSMGMSRGTSTSQRRRIRKRCLRAPGASRMGPTRTSTSHPRTRCRPRILHRRTRPRRRRHRPHPHHRYRCRGDLRGSHHHRQSPGSSMAGRRWDPHTRKVHMCALHITIIVLCVPGDLHVASGCASTCRPRVLRVLRVPHVFGLLPLGLPLEVGWMCHAFCVFCSTTSKRSRRRSQPRQRIHPRSRR